MIKGLLDENLRFQTGINHSEGSKNAEHNLTPSCCFALKCVLLFDCLNSPIKIGRSFSESFRIKTKSIGY